MKTPLDPKLSVTRAEIAAFNAGVAAMAEIAAASADALRARITEAPTRFNFAIGALEGLADAAADLMLPSIDLNGAQTAEHNPDPDDVTGPSTSQRKE